MTSTRLQLFCKASSDIPLAVQGHTRGLVEGQSGAVVAVGSGECGPLTLPVGGT